MSCPLGTACRAALWGTARFVPSRADDSQSPNAVGFGRPAGCGAAWLARLLWEQEAAGSNPAIPTSSEHIWILLKIVCGAAMGAKFQRVEHGGPYETRPWRGLGLL